MAQGQLPPSLPRAALENMPYPNYQESLIRSEISRITCHTKKEFCGITTSSLWFVRVSLDANFPNNDIFNVLFILTEKSIQLRSPSSITDFDGNWVVTATRQQLSAAYRRKLVWSLQDDNIDNTQIKSIFVVLSIASGTCVQMHTCMVLNYSSTNQNCI